MKKRSLDRYGAPNENFVRVAGPHSGPRRAERAKQTLPTSQGRSSAGKGISSASPWLVGLAVAAGLLMVSRPMLAHHSMAIYDQTREITLTGTVTEFRLTNPHMQLLFDVKSDQGDVKRWSSIGDNPVNLRRKGWTRNTIKANDQITITGYPAKDGRALMTTNKLVVNGKELD